MSDRLHNINIYFGLEGVFRLFLLKYNLKTKTEENYK